MKKQILIGLLLLNYLFAMAQQKQIDSLMQICKNAETDTNNTKAFIALSEIYKNSNLDSATLYAQKAIELAIERKQEQMQCNANNALGFAHYYNGKYTSAIAAYEQTFNIANKIDNKISKGFAKNNIGNVYIELGDYSTALAMYKEAAAIRLEAKDSNGIAMSYNNMGYIFKELGDYEKGIENFLKALRIFESMKNAKSIATTNNYLGAIYWRKKDYKLAHEHIGKAYAFQEKMNNAENMAVSLHLSGSVYAEEGKMDSAYKCFRRTLEIYEKNNDSRQISLSYADIGELMMMNKKTDSAVYYFNKSIEISLAIGNKRSLGSIYTSLAIAQLQAKNASACKNALDIAFDILNANNKKDELSVYYLTLSNYYKAIGDNANALKYIDIHGLYKDSLLNEANQKAIADMQTKYDVDKKDKQIQLQDITISKRNWTLSGLGLLSVLLALLGWSFIKRQKLKQQSTLQQQLLQQQDIATKAVIEAEERERKRIGSDLHDGIGQLMVAAKMNLSAIADRVVFETETDKIAYQKSIALVDEGCKEVRAVSHAIMPNSLLRAGLANAIKEFIDKLDNRVIKINLHTEGLNQRLEANVEMVLYRIIQECVNNVIKHAAANILNIALVKDAEGISVSIEDNGKGFDVQATENTEGIGLKNMQTRVAFLKGSIEIDSTLAKGTMISIFIPV